MSAVTIVGAGAFGTALAISLAGRGGQVNLWGRDADAIGNMRMSRQNARYLPEIDFPELLKLSANSSSIAEAEIILLAVPTQYLRDFITSYAELLNGKTCVVCCKGIEKTTSMLPSEIVKDLLPNAKVAVLTGPGFAAEIARGLPTALTLATDMQDGSALQSRMSTRNLRLYLSADPVGAQLGGALKNVIAIACGIAIGAGLGESARAALMTRGYAEMMRLAVDMGADPNTLCGLSGLGDLALTCGSDQSRNFSLGLRLGQGKEPLVGATFEGVATARATVGLAAKRNIEMPIAGIVAAVLAGELTINQASEALLSRPLRDEN
ncbi:MAG: NAD(P)-dependent glycerol-3-phosphate dehydrogenase [Alphaproteobacteria bacterium]|nr:NAD(P)-dependent glycerol-3-phosphate dehydrogenase [Alphaproteobacteria bacterium]